MNIYLSWNLIFVTKIIILIYIFSLNNLNCNQIIKSPNQDFYVMKFILNYDRNTAIFRLSNENVSRPKVRKGILKAIFNDPGLHQQWYLISPGYNNFYLSHELDAIWASGITGKNVNIGIVGAGIEETHKDLSENYNKELSMSFVTNQNPINPDELIHSTRSAGLISAVPNNGECGVGTAPFSTFSVLRILDNQTKYSIDDRVSEALVYKNNLIHIYALNFKINFRSERRNFPGSNTINALRSSKKIGRGGLGNIYIIGSGNYKKEGNNCAFSGLIQRPEVFAIGSISYNGMATLFSEECTALIASTLTTNDFTKKENIYSVSLNNECGVEQGDAYSASSIASGIVALLLSNNHYLSQRQIMILLITTSIQHDRGSIRNAAGYYYSYRFGFGLINAKKLIIASRDLSIVSLSLEHICLTKKVNYINIGVKMNSRIFNIFTTGCIHTNYCVSEIEQTHIIFTITSWRRNSIMLFLTSPSGTKFNILSPRRFDLSRNGIYSWRIKIMGYFGETPAGVWQLEIISISNRVKLVKLELEFYGTCNNPTINTITYTNAIDFILQSNQTNFFKFINDFITIPDVSLIQIVGVDKFSFTEIDFPTVSMLRSIL